MLSRRGLLKSAVVAGASFFGLKTVGGSTDKKIKKSCPFCMNNKLSHFDCAYSQHINSGKIKIFHNITFCTNCKAIGGHRMPVADTRAFTADGLIWTDNYIYTTSIPSGDYND